MLKYGQWAAKEAESEKLLTNAYLRSLCVREGVFLGVKITEFFGQIS